ncbi:hypothetical protein EI42_05783 [Thermosporothrix hazakensis]|jgi:uncharacterized membrane protein|uniref:Uncharacterized protein n=1 Tax=Thermosporothrix hazakensis TaxID=644383 RepID=A0A326TVB8_THEHA|nr:hypothetical protein [Thermosporothrix hazakensis]PZW21021.1 hypothetical protein EI42_05783 [Thermosporothrix hazakensis]GCE49304.1 hypothetical protein KTH_41730 [Thermosporothrix hazakensis]
MLFATATAQGAASDGMRIFLIVLLCIGIALILVGGILACYTWYNYRKARMHGR